MVNPNLSWYILANNNKDNKCPNPAEKNVYENFKSLAGSEPREVSNDHIFATWALNADFTEKETAEGIAILKSGEAVLN